MKRMIAMLRRRGAVVVSSLVLVAAGLMPGSALAQSGPRTIYLHYGISPWGYTLIAVETIACDGTYQYSPINYGTITYTEVQNYEC